MKIKVEGPKVIVEGPKVIVAGPKVIVAGPKVIVAGPYLNLSADRNTPRAPRHRMPTTSLRPFQPRKHAL